MREFNEVKVDLVKEIVKREVLSLECGKAIEDIEHQIDSTLETTGDMTKVQKLVTRQMEIERTIGLAATINNILKLKRELIASAKEEFIKRNMMDADMDKIFHECEGNVGIMERTVKLLLN